MSEVQKYPEVVKMVSENDISSLVSSPHSGKTRELAILLAKLVSDQGGKQVICVKPNRLSMMLNYNESKSRQSNGVIGHASEGDEKYANTTFNPDSKYDTSLVYTTAEYLNMKILELLKDNSNDPNIELNFCNILMIDEAYSGNTDTDLLIYLWRECYNTGLRVPKLLLLDSSQGIIEYLPPYPVVTIDTQLANVTYAIPTSQDSPSSSPGFPYDRLKYSHLAKIVSSYHAKNPLQQTREDSWIVFLPNESEVLKFAKVLSKLDVEIIRLWSYDLRNPDTKKIKNPLIGGTRRIILTTSMGEHCLLKASIVFDSMTHTINVNGVDNIAYISKIQAHHRSVNASSLVVRHIQEPIYDNLVMNGTMKEIKSQDLASVSFYMLSNSLDYNNFFSTLGVNEEKIKTNNAEMASLDLVQYDKEYEAYIPTNAGNFVYKSGLPIKEGLMLYKWIHTSKRKSKSLYSAVACITMFKEPIVNHSNDEVAKFLVKGYEYNDVVTNLAILTGIIGKIGSSDLSGHTKELIEICSLLKINLKTLINVTNIINERVMNLVETVPEIRGLTNDSLESNLAEFMKDFDKIVTDVYRSQEMKKIKERPMFYIHGHKTHRWSPMNKEYNKSLPPSIFSITQVMVKDKFDRVHSMIKHAYVPKTTRFSSKTKMKMAN